ncbi:MAG TPA: cupin domain-containing protein [Haliangiales bacterium]|nr:cupin domain-containing protein [Haliangiales bacterium]
MAIPRRPSMDDRGFPRYNQGMKITHSNDLPWTPALERGKFGQRRKALGGEKMPCGLWELAPGKRSFPLHVHHVTEEAMWVVSGRAKVRTPDGEADVGPGDFVSFPAGGKAHQLINDGTEPFVYVGMSAIAGFDVVEYPDSKKVGVAIGGFPAARRMIFRADQQADYFEGED